MIVKFRLRRDTAASWTANNPVLSLGEPGLETDTRRVKYGDGATAWNSLAYSSGTAALANIGTSGANVPLLNGSNTWSANQTFGEGNGSPQIHVDGGSAGVGGYVRFKQAGATIAYIGAASGILGESNDHLLLYANTTLRLAGINGIVVDGGIDNTGDRIRVRTAKTPSSASDTGAQGQICWDGNYLYVCVATNSWKRVALSAW